MLDRERARQEADRRAAGAAWQESDAVIATPAGGPLPHRMAQKQWAAALAAAGLPHRPFHDLRHGANSLLEWLGVSIAARMAILGHTAVRTNLHYTHLADAEVAGALDRLGRLLDGQQP